MQTIELTVDLKIPDVTALTAANALRRRLGYEDVLVNLHRADYYRLEIAVENADEAVAMGKKLAEETNLFVNPNKHQYSVAAGIHNSGAEAAEGTYAVNMLVTDPKSGSAAGILNALHGRLGYGDIVNNVSAGILWTLVLKAESQSAAEEIATKITVTKSREEGLLLNPHFQECEMW